MMSIKKIEPTPINNNINLIISQLDAVKKSFLRM